MKTTKILAVISLVLIVLGASAIQPGQVNQAGGSMPPAGNIKYTVTIHVNPPAALPAVHFFAVLSDGNGRRIGAPQQVVIGKVNYFSEIGPVNGTRVASLIEMPEHGAYIPFSCNPDAKTGIFRNGVIYNFNLYPSLALPN